MSFVQKYRCDGRWEESSMYAIYLNCWFMMVLDIIFNIVVNEQDTDVLIMGIKVRQG